MKHRWLRLLSLLLCLQILMSCMPVLSEETPDAAALEIVDIAQIAEAAEPAAAEETAGDVPAAKAESEAAEESPASEATAAPEPQASAEATVEATVEPTVEATVAPPAEPTPAPSAEPSVQPSGEPAPEASAEATAEPLPEVTVLASPEAEMSMDGVMLLSVADMDAVVDSWLAEMAKKNYSLEFDKAFWLYKKLITSVDADSSSNAAQTAEAALVDGKAGSMGFALAYEYLLTAANIDCDILTERSDENEAWNIVRINGKWTHVDPFHDARHSSTGECFGLTDSAMARYHSWARSSHSCTTTAVNYYVLEKDYLPCGDMEDLLSHLLSAVEGHSDSIRLYWYGEEDEVNLALALRLLSSIAPDAEISGSENGCYCILELSYGHGLITPTPAGATTPKPTVTPVPEAEEIIPAESEIVMGLEEERSVAGWTLRPEGAENEVSYSSSNSSRLSVDKDGMLRAKKTGSATVTLTADNGVECEIDVEIKKAPTKISSFVAERTVLGVGESTATRFSFNSGAGGGVHYSSNDEIVATVDEDGVITARQSGEATITITSYNGLEKSGVITVKKAPESITLEEDEVLLGKDDRWQLGYTLSKGSTGAVSFFSSDEEVASVDAKGYITALKAGSAVITAETYNGLRAACRVTVTQSPEDVTLTAERTTIGVGEEIQLIAQILPEGTLGSLKFKSSSTKYVTVDENGVATAKKAGSSTITVETYNGKTATLKLTVKKAPSSISLSAERSSLAVGESVQLSVKLSSGSVGSYTLASSDESKLIIDENGLATALSGGEVKVTAETHNGKKKTITLNIIAEPEIITLSESQISIGEDDSWQLSYRMNEGAGGAVSFSSSNPAVASVDEKGNISALKEGTAVITAQAYNGVFAQCYVYVVSAPYAVEFITQRSELGKDEELQLEARILPEGTLGSLRYTSSNTRILSVDENGVVTAERTGSASITVETYNGKTAEIEFTVKSEPKSISFTSDHSSMGVGETAHLSASLPSGSAGAYRFSSSDESVLTIDENGYATAHAAGKAEVTVIAYNNKKSSRSITVSAAPTGLILSRSSVSIGADDSWQLSYTHNEGEGSCVKFASSNERVATVDANGVISAHAAGYADIIARTYNGIEASCRVTVVAAPAGVVLNAPRLEIGQGEEMQLTAETLPDGAVGTLKFSSNNSKYVSVDENGVVTGVRKGTGVITVETYNGKTASVRITVKSEPKSISLTTDRTVLGLGERAQLTASINENSAGGYSFISGDESILSIDADGVATAHATGEVKVTAVAYNGVKKSGTIRVMEAPKFLMLSPASVTLGLGDSSVINAQLNEAAAGAVTYSSLNPSIVSVDPATGAITGHAIGTTFINAVTYNGVRASVSVSVCPQPSTIRVPYGILEIGVDDKVQLKPEIDPGTATNFSYSTSSNKYATVDANGIVTGERTGSAEITISTSNGLRLVLSVRVRKAPTSIELLPGDLTLGVGESVQLLAELNEGSAGSVLFDAVNADVASVDENGVLTALAVGESEIRVESYNGLSDSVHLTVAPAPTSILIDAITPIGVGQQTQLNVTMQPEGSHSTVRFELMDGDAVQVDENGLITGLKEGSAIIRATTHVAGVADSFRISVKPAPTSIAFDAEEYEISIDDSLLLRPILSPNGCVTQLSYSMERAGFFTLDENGLITPIMRGSTTVTVTTHNGLSATVLIRIIDPHFPEELEFIIVPPTYLDVGDSFEPQVAVYPETAVAALEWSSSDPDIASIDPETGRVVAESHGSATIEAVSTRNPALMLSYKLTVLSPERCLKMPARRTEISQIATTQSQIKQVRSSAYRELESLYTRGEISKSEYNTRKSIVSNAFDMYLFPWMTKELELYWSGANSEDGAKDFKPGIVYHGLPYTQTNRRYNVTSALSKGLYYDSGKGYYLMDNDKVSNRMYGGNDCSSFASMSVWGTGKSHSYDTTRDIGKTDVYTTISDWDELRTGDLLNLYNHHVVIFLYWANESHTQMVIIEQGGGEAGTNTVSCSLRKTSYYQDKGYSVRRLTSLM